MEQNKNLLNPILYDNKSNGIIVNYIIPCQSAKYRN